MRIIKSGSGRNKGITIHYENAPENKLANHAQAFDRVLYHAICNDACFYDPVHRFAIAPGRGGSVVVPVVQFGCVFAACFVHLFYFYFHPDFI